MPVLAILREVVLHRAPVALLPARVEVLVGDLVGGGGHAGPYRTAAFSCSGLVVAWGPAQAFSRQRIALRRRRAHRGGGRRDALRRRRRADRLPRRHGRPVRAGLAGGSRHRRARRARRPGSHRRPAVDARQPARAVRRRLRPQGRRGRGGADLDPRQSLRQRPARARPRHHRRRARARARRDALPARGCPTTRPRCCCWPASSSSCSGSPSRPADKASITWSRSRPPAPSSCSSSTAPGCRPYLRADTRADATTEERKHAPGCRSRCGPRIVLLAISGVGAAFVSDWFIASLNPAIEALHLSKALRRPRHRRDRRQRGRERRRHHARHEGQDRSTPISVVKNSVAQIAAFLFPALVLISLLFYART